MTLPQGAGVTSDMRMRAMLGRGRRMLRRNAGMFRDEPPGDADMTRLSACGNGKAYSYRDASDSS